MEYVERAFKSPNNISYTHLLSLSQIEVAYASSGSLVGQNMLKIVLNSVFSTYFGIFGPTYRCEIQNDDCIGDSYPLDLN